MNASGLSPEQVKLQARARELAAGPVSARAAEVDRSEQYPWDNVELLKDAKLIGMTIPTQYGGQGIPPFDPDGPWRIPGSSAMLFVPEPR